MADQHLFSKTLKTTKPADSERLAGGSGSSSDYNFTWTKLREWIGDIASFIFTGNVTIDGNLDLTTTATNHLLLPSNNDPTTPTLAFGDGDTGFYEVEANDIGISIGGESQVRILNDLIRGSSTSKFGLKTTIIATAIIPNILPKSSDSNTGIGRADDDKLSLISGGVEGIRITESAGAITVDMVTSGTVLTVGVGADNGTVSAGIFTDRTKHYDGDALKEIKKIKGLDGDIIHSTLPSFAQAKVKKTNTILGDRITVKEADAFDDKEVLKEGVKIDEGIYYTQTETIEETEDDERDLGAMISVLTKGIQQQLVINEDLINRIKQLENNI